MLKTNWKSTALLAAIAAASVALLFFAFVGMVTLPLFGSSGLLSWFVLVILTLAASRLTVSVTSADGIRCYRKSIADAFVFLAVVLYAGPPAHVVWPAIVLAALVGFVSTYRLGTHREIIFTTGMSVVSTFVAASFYGFLVDLFADTAAAQSDSGLPLNVLLVPLFTLAVLQYTLNTIATSWFLSIDAGKLKWMPSPESVVWTLTT